MNILGFNPLKKGAMQTPRQIAHKEAWQHLNAAGSNVSEIEARIPEVARHLSQAGYSKEEISKTISEMLKTVEAKAQEAALSEHRAKHLPGAMKKADQILYKAGGTRLDTASKEAGKLLLEAGMKPEEAQAFIKKSITKHLKKRYRGPAGFFRRIRDGFSNTFKKIGSWVKARIGELGRTIKRAVKKVVSFATGLIKKAINVVGGLLERGVRGLLGNRAGMLLVDLGKAFKKLLVPDSI